ncbi:MAG: sigma factor, partial [Propionibacteriaceae bacterium]|nr:sigma factor [Propionibacteriaceae bacterium]
MTNVVFPAAELLAPEEEIELARRMEAGTLAAAVLTGEREFSAATVAELTALAREGRAARERYVEANLRLVAMVAYPAARRAGLSFTELFQEGAGGLLLAVDRFDHTQRVRFATYALPWIREQVSRAVGNRCGALPLSGF